MLNADPVTPVWGPMCPWGPGYGRFGGGWGSFRWLGTGSVCQGSSEKIIVSAVTRRQRGGFRTFWLIGTAFALRNFLTPTTLGSVWDFFRQFAMYRFFRGPGDLEKFCGRPGPKTGPKTGQKHQKVDFPGLGGRSGRNTRRIYLILC